MKKFFKSMAASALIAGLLVANSVPAMAAETVRDVAKTEAVVETVETRVSPVATYRYEGQITKAGQWIGSIDLSSFRPRTIKYCVTGTGGNVIINLTNRNTGDIRGFTAVGDGRVDSITYTANMQPGVWDIKAVFVSGSGHDVLEMEFYK